MNLNSRLFDINSINATTIAIAVIATPKLNEEWVFQIGLFIKLFNHEKLTEILEAKKKV